MGFASIGYVPEDGWYAGTEARYMGDIMADDENTVRRRLILSSAYSPGINTITTI